MFFPIRILSRCAAGAALLAGAGALVLHPGAIRAAAEQAAAPVAQAQIADSTRMNQTAAGIVAQIALPRQAIVAATPPPSPVIESTSEDPVRRVSALGLPCGLSVDATVLPGALVGLDIIAPCQPGAILTIEHAGLRLDLPTDALGLLTVDLPAFETPAFIDVTLPDGQVETVLAPVPELATMIRAALHWTGPPAFDLHALEFGAEFGGPGHVWRDTPATLEAALDGSGGFLMELGNASGTDTTRAQVYSLPQDSLRDGDTVDLSVDAAITPETCGQPLNARALLVVGNGRVEHTPVRLTMPGCDAIGDYLVLQNLFDTPRLSAN